MVSTAASASIMADIRSFASIIFLSGPTCASSKEANACQSYYVFLASCCHRARFIALRIL
eukprot:scaffold109207_cov34-Tisochrysis_lutea.AAC.1